MSVPDTTVSRVNIVSYEPCEYHNKVQMYNNMDNETATELRSIAGLLVFRRELFDRFEHVQIHLDFTLWRPGSVEIDPRNRCDVGSPRHQPSITAIGVAAATRMCSNQHVLHTALKPRPTASKPLRTVSAHDMLVRVRPLTPPLAYGTMWGGCVPRCALVVVHT